VSPTDDKITESGGVAIDATYATGTTAGTTNGTTTFGAKGIIFSITALFSMLFFILWQIIYLELATSCNNKIIIFTVF